MPDELARQKPIIITLPQAIWYLVWNCRGGHYEVCTAGWLEGAPHLQIVAGPCYEPAQAWAARPVRYAP